MKKKTKVISYIIALAMIVTTLQVAPATTAQAAAKAKLSKKTLTLTIGKSKTLTLKNVKKSVAKKATWKTSKKKKLTCKVTVKKAKQTQNAVQVAPTQAPATQAPAPATPAPAAPTPEGIQTKKNVTIMLKSVSGKTITNQELIICCQEPIRLLLVWDQGWNR